ncbi:glutathione peroxidase [Anoxynatronum buryatiense]|uniref:Glutathione peroxidase n=1 Tax=Anoxynatronum buryatiense TaxID=489973 RepID=A0AA46AJ88_9CLOT|nr:glutathione peroxidase [Anoxynatronum buryatiense]SMP58752.1 glutathione peroxidase [Anoxynatronum buryatiense]
MGFYELSATNIDGETVSMADYKGKVVVVVNTASKCGLTPQFKELEAMYQDYRDKGFEILGFPTNQFANQDPGSNDEIQQFCQLNYGVTFTMFEKIDVNGENAHPIFKYLKQEKKSLLGSDIKWNFAKFLIDSSGQVVKRYAPTTAPAKMRKDIEKQLS